MGGFQIIQEIVENIWLLPMQLLWKDLDVRPRDQILQARVQKLQKVLLPDTFMGERAKKKLWEESFGGQQKTSHG